MQPEEKDAKRPVREPSLLDAFIPLIALVVLIGGAIALFGLQALDGPIPAALVICSMIAMLVIFKNGHSVDEVQEAANRAMVLASQGSSMAEKVAVYVAIVVTMAIAWIVLRVGDKVVARMGETGIRVMTRIMGLLLAAIAMQFVISGASEA